MDSFQRESIYSTPYFHQVRPHNCPNCSCSHHFPQSKETSEKLSAPIFTKNIPSNSNIYNPSNCKEKGTIIIKSNDIRQNYLQPSNIYYRRTERDMSENSSRSGYSREGSNRKVVIISPPKTPSRINIQYLSPQPYNRFVQREKIETENKKGMQKEKRSLYLKSQPSIKKEQTSNKFRDWNSKPNKQLNLCQQNINAPRTPSILKRKSIENNKKHLLTPMTTADLRQAHFISRFASTPIQQLSEIRKSVKSSFLPTPGVEVQNKQKGSSMQKLGDLLEKQQDRLIAMQITKELKLHYDYFDCPDLSKLSTNIH